MTIGRYLPDHDGNDLRIGIVQARFNENITHGLFTACVDELKKLGLTEEDILHVTVPGALELPIALKHLAVTYQFDALIAIGAVIRGETYHFEVVSNESARGITEVALNEDIPIANAVLTCNTDEQALQRVDEKGRDAARVAVEMANVCIALSQLAEASAEAEQGEDDND